jgi:hypothetical protein
VVVVGVAEVEDAGDGEAEEEPPTGTIVPLVGGEEVRLVPPIAAFWSAAPRGLAWEPPPSHVETATASSTTSSTELPSAIARRRQYTDCGCGPVGSIMTRR